MKGLTDPQRMAWGAILALGLWLAAALAAAPGPARAAAPLAVGLPVSIVGGPGNTAVWDLIPDGGTNTGEPTSFADCFSPGAGPRGILVDDAALGAQRDAFDQAGIWLNQQVFTSTIVATTTHSVAAGPMAVGGLQVTLDYRALADTATLRTLVSAYNPGAASAVLTVTLAANFGSDLHTEVLATSTGDADLTAADRWLVTADSASAPTDVVNTTVLAGPGLPAVGPNLVSDQVFACPGAGDTQGVLAEFRLPLPGGATRRLMFFHQLNPTPSTALAGAAGFDATPPVGGPLITGLSLDQLREIENWQYGARVFLPSLRR